MYHRKEGSSHVKGIRHAHGRAVEFYLLKGDRGDREGKYLWVTEIESVEARDRYYPSPGEMSEEVQRLFAPYAAVWEKWETFATPVDVIYTDYVVVGK